MCHKRKEIKHSLAFDKGGHWSMVHTLDQSHCGNAGSNWGLKKCQNFNLLGYNLLMDCNTTTRPCRGNMNQK